MSLSGYHSSGSFDVKKREEIIKKCVKELRGYEFDALAVRGVSGLIVGPVVAYLLKKHVIVVRKPNNVESSHASQTIESPINSGVFIIFDDFVGSGRTAVAILEAVITSLPGMTCLGGYSWSRDQFDNSNDLLKGVKNLHP